MSNILQYKGYRAKAFFSAEDGCFVGNVLGIRDVISFEGDTVQELESMFRESIDDYLESCKEWGKKPDKEYRGTFNVRITPQAHCEAVAQAEEMGVSLNQFVAEAIQEKLTRAKTQYQIDPPALQVSEAPVLYRSADAAQKDADILEAAARVIRKYQKKA